MARSVIASALVTFTIGKYQELDIIDIGIPEDADVEEPAS
jgi:hypothetical protein